MRDKIHNIIRTHESDKARERRSNKMQETSGISRVTWPSVQSLVSRGEDCHFSRIYSNENDLSGILWCKPASKCKEAMPDDSTFPKKPEQCARLGKALVEEGTWC